MVKNFQYMEQSWELFGDIKPSSKCGVQHINNIIGRTIIDQRCQFLHFIVDIIFISMPIVFIFVWIGWTFFRADNVSHAIYLFQRMMSFDPGIMHAPYFLLLLVFAVWVYQLIRLNSGIKKWMEGDPARVVLGAMMIIYLMFGSASGGAFIYFQF